MIRFLSWIGIVFMFISLSLHAGIVEQCWDQSANKQVVNECLSSQLMVLEQRIAAADQELKIQAQELDQKTDSDNHTFESYVRAQMSFQVYRQFRCEWQAAMFASGSGAGTEQLSCKIEVSQQWLSQLNNYQ
ncbi:DUF1311 domain-containing protein [Alginatibacterium sediminis]|uniref:DUF1311 domain-containing protein n=1 Tax=Alginatibacterium sediminis TaxID=2164068 RepID=A0A420E9X0_9ALTE|nr:lysozyme inhibitor LprI family protein [Alginatibacterium sediminis]RKF17469.1 DUF1311 domain-containing protein [Alginatibacterium sediminis]